MAGRTAIDLAFAEFWFELSALEEHPRLVEDQMKNAQESERLKFEEYARKHDLTTPEDDDRHLMWDEYQRNRQLSLCFLSSCGEVS